MNVVLEGALTGLGVALFLLAVDYLHLRKLARVREQCLPRRSSGAPKYPR